VRFGEPVAGKGVDLLEDARRELAVEVGVADPERVQTAEFAADPRPWQKMLASLQNRTMSHTTRK
jgi:hypothetical protein